MDILVLSDSHRRKDLAVCVLEKEKDCKTVFFLGDGEAEFLQLRDTYKDRSFICVRGNCDTEVDQMVLDFPILADYAVLYDGERELFATHGHHVTPENPPRLAEGSILLGGHTHVAEERDCGHFRYVNPGSVSIPKGGTDRGCLIYENGCFIRISLEDAL